MRLLEYIWAYLCHVCEGEVKILFPVRIDKTTVLEKPNYIGRHCVLIGTKVGRYTYFGNDCEFYYSKIGRFCGIANDVKLVRGQHPTNTHVSISPLFYQSITCFGNGFVSQNIFQLNKKCSMGGLCNIGNDVWIGSHVRIMEGVTIGNGAIIGAGAVVTKDVPPYSICVGVPAKVIKYRFTEYQISLLQRTEWWNWDDNKLRQMAQIFSNIELFISTLIKE